MSFILDALKKSENERKRAVGPSLVDAPLRRQQVDRPWWAVAVGALLMVNLGVLLVVLIRRDADPDTAPVATAPPVPAPAMSNVPANAPRLRSQSAVMGDPSVRPLADEAAGYGEDQYRDAPPPEGYEASPNPDVAAAAANVPAGPPIVRPIEAPAVAPLPSRPAAQAPSQPSFNSSTGPNDEVLPTLSALVASGTSLPELRLDIHVYSANPADRFAFVNMRKYLEGQALTEGPTLERITPDGVVLNSQGRRFLLPRQ